MKKKDSAMGGYQLSLQAGSYNSVAQLEVSQKTSSGSTASADGSGHGKKSRSNSPGGGFGFFQAKRVASQQNLEGLLQASPPRHSTACCDGLSERREVERRLSSQKMKVGPPVTRDPENGDGDSFRSEDSESLALWEEKEPVSNDHGWMKLTTQSPRWLEAMRKFGWSSPVHPKSSRDTPHVSLDRKASQRSLHDSSKTWYSNATKKIRNGESRSVRSPTSTSNFMCQSGELCESGELHPSKYEHETVLTSGDSKRGSFSRLIDEDTSFTTSTVTWDFPSRPEAYLDKARPVNAMAWGIPTKDALETETEKFVDLNSMKTKNAHSVTGKSVSSSASEGDLSNASNHGRGELFFDGQSEYASCRTFADAELLESSKDTKSTVEDPAEFVNVIDFVAPLRTEIHSMEDNDTSAVARTKSSERRIPFKWEARQAKQLRVEEVAPATEFPQPPPFVTKDGYESLHQQHVIKSKGAPLDGLYVVLPKTSQSGITKPRPPRAPASIIREDYVAPDSFLKKSRSSSDADGPLRRAYNSPDQRLFTKLRKSVFGAGRGPSPLGRNNNLDDLSSPRSILRGPEDGSVPSSNPSLRSDPGTPAFSAIPTYSASDSISSCSASFDLNDSGDFEMTYDLNSTAACVIVESRRVSLSFRDFGPARPSGEDTAVKVEDASENATSSIELLSCGDRFDTNALGLAIPETMQSPELWTATFSARYLVCDSPLSGVPDNSCAATEGESEFVSPAPVSRATNGVQSEDKEQEVQVPIVIQKSRSRNGEFTARLGVMFSPLRLISSHESNHSCFVAATLSPPHDDDDHSPTYAATLEFMSTSEIHSSSAKGSKAKSSWTHGEKVKLKPSSRRHSSDDSQTMMVSISKTMKKILSKVTVKRFTSKEKSKLGSPLPGALSPAEYQLTEVN